MSKELLELVGKVDPKIMTQVEKVLKAHMEEMAKANPPQPNADGSMPAAPAMDPQVVAALKAVVRILTPFKDKINDGLLDSVLSQAGFDMSQDGEGDEDEGDDGTTIKEEHLQGGMAAANNAYKEHMEKLGYQKYPTAQMAMKEKNVDLTDEEEEDEAEDFKVSKEAIMKADGSLNLEAVPEAVRPAVEAIYKGQQEAVKKAAELEATLKKERDERRAKEFIAKAETFKHYVGDKAALAKDLQALSDSNNELYEKIVKQLEATDSQAEIVAKAAFKEIGSQLPGNTGTHDAWAKIEKLAEGVVAKSDKVMTQANAIESVLLTREGQALYEEYKNSRKDRV